MSLEAYLRSRLGYVRGVADQSLAAAEQVRTAEVIASLSLATDLGIVVPLEHGLQSTLLAMRLADGMGVDPETASQTYYACLLFYVGCTANADVAAGIFGGHESLTTYGLPARFGSRPEMVRGLMRAIAPPGTGLGARRGARARPPEAGEALQSPDRCSMRGGSDADRPPRPPLDGGGTLQLRLGAVGWKGPTAPRRS